MQVLLQIFYLAMAVDGFMEWRQGRTEVGSRDPVMERLAARRRGAVRRGGDGVERLAAESIHARISSAGTPSPFITWSSVITTWMVARRVIENWLYWIVVDGPAAYLYFTKGLLATTLLFVIYLGVVVRGYVVWRREQAMQHAGAGSLAVVDHVAR